MSKWAAHVDGNHVEIVNGLRAFGASVKSLAAIGKGCPDLLVGYKGLNFLIEVKSGRGKLNEEQVKWAESWKGTTTVVWSLQEAIDYLVERTQP